jgi:hypothetical protein
VEGKDQITTYRVYTPVGKKSWGYFALNVKKTEKKKRKKKILICNQVSMKATEFFSSTFLVPYAMPKQDHIPVPALVYDAMESKNQFPFQSNLTFFFSFLFFSSLLRRLGLLDLLPSVSPCGSQQLHKWADSTHGSSYRSRYFQNAFLVIFN